MIQGVVDRKEGVRGGEVETGRGGGREGKENGMRRQGGGQWGGIGGEGLARDGSVEGEAGRVDRKEGAGGDGEGRREGG